MGTRSLTIFKENDGTEIAVLYRQMDGYPSGHGKDLLGFLKDRQIVNGFRDGDDGNSNGMSNLVVQCISYLFKLFGEKVGNLYLHPAGTRDAGEDYTYTVYMNPEEIPTGYKRWENVFPLLKVESLGKVLYDGLAKDFNPQMTEDLEDED